MDVFETKKAIFYKDKIYIKKENKYIAKEDILFIYYAKMNIRNYFLHLKEYILVPGCLVIFLKKRSFFRFGYRFRMKIEDVKKIPKSICKNFKIIE